MLRFISFILSSFFFLLFSTQIVKAQVVSPATDSFFLAGKKGMLGRIGRSISKSSEPMLPIKTTDPYKKYHGKIIRTISISSVGFNYDLNDTVPIKNNLAIKISNKFHKNTLPSVIQKNLFFKVGQPFYPLVVADNERFLREQTFLRDAMIEVLPSIYSKDSVDVIILTRDVFSIGGSFSASGIDRAKSEIKEENIAGSGNRFALFGLYDKARNPNHGYGAELMLRNIGGSFVNWENGFKTFRPAFNSGRMEEVHIYSQIEKPMASRYTAITGAAEVSYHSTINGYLADSLYSNDYRYRYINTDVWGGFNFGYNSGKKKDSENRLRHFVAMRGFYNSFIKVPAKYLRDYNYQYADINGVLMSYSLYRQNFYRTNFIYGFGRNEDVPEGINASFIGGYTNKQGVKRSYVGLEMEASRFTKKEGLFSYTFKTGGYFNSHKMQDVDILLGANHFTKLFTINRHWYNRSFMGLSYTRQIEKYLNEPLFLRSEFGLPSMRSSFLEGESRTSVSFESVFYNMKKLVGFRFAPFVFGNLCLLQPLNEPKKNTKGYQSLGAGIRSRNENLVFGTMELKGYFFPRVPDGMKNWRVDLTTKLLFKYNSSFIRRPDFVSPN
ncbi:MAG: hypothetical protein ACOYLO_14155 [Ferruginibacter sp.]